MPELIIHKASLNFQKGLFSFEAGVSFVVLILMIAGTATEYRGGRTMDSGAEMFASQKISDLLTVWAVEGTRDNEMISDANFFIGNTHEIEIEEKKIFSSIGTKRSGIVSMEIIIVRGGRPEKVRVSVAVQ